MDIAGWIWDKKNLNDAADGDDILEITRALKGDYLIIREREEILKRVKKAIQIV
jgi:putative chitinase